MTLLGKEIIENGTYYPKKHYIFYLLLYWIFPVINLANSLSYDTYDASEEQITDKLFVDNCKLLDFN